MKYETLIATVARVHKEAQAGAAGAVNHHCILRNWPIGDYLVEFEQNGEDRAKHGAGLLKRVSTDQRQRAISGCSTDALEHIFGFPGLISLNSFAWRTSGEVLSAKTSASKAIGRFVSFKAGSPRSFTNPTAWTISSSFHAISSSYPSQSYLSNSSKSTVPSGNNAIRNLQPTNDHAL